MEMDTTEKRLVGFAIIAITTLAILTILSPTVNAPSGRRWPVTTGMELPLVNILDQNGYYATLSCKVTSFDNIAHTYVFSCGDAPAVIQVGNR